MLTAPLPFPPEPNYIVEYKLTVNDQIEEQWKDLLRKGVLLVAGTDEDGNFEYQFDLEKLEKVNPDLYQAHIDEVDTAIMSLFSKGFLDLTFTDEGVMVEPTPKIKQFLQEPAE